MGKNKARFREVIRMNLIQYRDEIGTSFAWIGRKVGLSTQAISAIAYDKMKPSWEKAGLIESATRGLVPRAQWYPPEAGLVPDPSPTVTDVTRITPVTPSPVT